LGKAESLVQFAYAALSADKLTKGWGAGIHWRARAEGVPKTDLSKISWYWRSCRR